MTAFSVAAITAAVLVILVAIGAADLATVKDIGLCVLGLAGIGGSGLAVANRPTLSQTERDQAAAITAAGHTLIRLVGSEAPAEEIDAAHDRLAGVLGRPDRLTRRSSVLRQGPHRPRPLASCRWAGAFGVCRADRGGGGLCEYVDPVVRFRRTWIP